MSKERGRIDHIGRKLTWNRKFEEGRRVARKILRTGHRGGRDAAAYLSR